MDKVFIRGLCIDTVIGVYAWEREIRQEVVLDLELGTNVTRAAATDALEDALDYGAVTRRLVEFVQGSEFHLVETLAERCAALLLQEFRVPWVRLSLDKRGALKEAAGVGVVIERRASPVAD